MGKLVEKYFSILRDYFSPALKWAYKRGYPAQEVSLQSMQEIYDPTVVRPMLESLYDDLMVLDWALQEETVREMGGLKPTYLGIGKPDVNTYGFLKRTALYSDTIIVDDYISDTVVNWKLRGSGDLTTLLGITRYAIHCLNIEDLFLSDLQPPMCTLAPPPVLSLEKKNLLNAAKRSIEKSSVSFASEMFGQTFPSEEKFAMFLQKIENYSDFVSKMQKPEILVESNGTPLSEESFQAHKRYFQMKYGVYSFAEALLFTLKSRFDATIPILMSDGRFTTNFVTDFRGAWHTLLWLMKNNNEIILKHSNERKSISKDMLILNALQQERLRWLGNIPLNKIRQLRERGELQDLRDLIGKNVKNIENVSDEDFVAVVRQVKYNLEEAFKQHNSDVKNLNEKYRRKYKIDVASLIVSGSLGIVSSLYPPLALATSVASGIVGSGSIIATVKDFIEKREKFKDLQKKPVAILFDAQKFAA